MYIKNTELNLKTLLFTKKRGGELTHGQLGLPREKSPLTLPNTCMFVSFTFGNIDVQALLLSGKRAGYLL